MLMTRMRETDSAARKGSADPLDGTVQSHPRTLASVRAHTQRPHMPCGRTYARAITWARAVTHLSSVRTQKIFRVPPPAALASPPLPTRAATRTSAAKANQESWCKARMVERAGTRPAELYAARNSEGDEHEDKYEDSEDLAHTILGTDSEKTRNSGGRAMEALWVICGGQGTYTTARCGLAYRS